MVAVGNAAAPQTESTAPTAPAGNALGTPTSPEPNLSSRSWALMAIGTAVLSISLAIAVAASRLRNQKTDKRQVAMASASKLA